jgi:hypothetical protein
MLAGSQETFFYIKTDTDISHINPIDPDQTSLKAAGRTFVRFSAKSSLELTICASRRSGVSLHSAVFQSAYQPTGPKKQKPAKPAPTEWNRTNLGLVLRKCVGFGGTFR